MSRCPACPGGVTKRLGRKSSPAREIPLPGLDSMLAANSKPGGGEI
jgi:hypothetical protein